MRLRQPCRLHQPHRAPDLMRFALILARQHRGRHQRRRQFYSFHDGLARQVAVEVFQFQRARRQQHAALPPPRGLVDQAGCEVVVEDRQRAGPVALGAAKSQHGLRRPGRSRRKFYGLFGDRRRREGIVGALRFDEQPAQAEQPCILALGHGAEGALRAFAVAVELRGLRVQQQRQRIVRGMAPRDVGVRAGGAGIAVADREQPLRDGVPAPRMTPLVARAANPLRGAPEPAQDRPGQHRRDDDHAEREHEHRQRCMDFPNAPRQRDIAALVGDPRSARRCERDQDKKQNDTMHQDPTGPVW